LLENLDFPLITTSGNRQDEPICITETEVLTRLDGIADYFLTHNRPVLRPLDDSIVREINGKMTVLRRARGYVPLPINTTCDLPGAIALGGQLKNTVAIAQKKHIILSQHLGNLETETAQQLFQSTLADLQDFYQIMPDTIMHDAHKGYFSSQFAENIAGTKVPVQHHYAHALSCMAEHQLEPPALAVVWDGSGMGDDNTLWGGEFLLITEKGFRRFAHFRPFPLPGGIKAIREPRRTALGLHYDIHADNIFDQPDLPFTHEELLLLKAALDKQINCPRTTSVGRLFDGVASMLGLCQISSYEGQAAMLLESLASETTTEQSYPFELIKGETIAVNWQITIKNLIKDLKQNTPSTIAAKFHNTLAEIMAAVAMLAQQQTIILSGGCFQNAVLAETAAGKLKSAGFNVYCHERVPPNDGGLALGQLVAAKYIGH
jgi:hydrogenase maturation protein HypF